MKKKVVYKQDDILKESENIKLDLDDIKINLNINRDLIKKHLLQTKIGINNKNEYKLINDLEEENIKLTNKMHLLLNEKLEIDKKNFHAEEILKKKIINEKELYEKLNFDSIQLNSKIEDKDEVLNRIKHELEKIISNKDIKGEHYIVEPTLNNVEINNEINYTNDILDKMNKIFNNEKIKNAHLDSQIKSLTRELDDLRKSYGESNTKSTKIIETYIEEEYTSLNSLEMSQDDIIREIDELNMGLDSPFIRFPDKVIMNVEIKNNIIPKLNFEKLRNKNDKRKIKENTFKTFSLKVNKEIDLQVKIDNINKEINNSNCLIVHLKNEIDKYKIHHKELKNKNGKLKENLIFANSKIENLKKQIRKFKKESKGKCESDIENSYSDDLDDLNLEMYSGTIMGN